MGVLEEEDALDRWEAEEEDVEEGEEKAPGIGCTGRHHWFYVALFDDLDWVVRG